MGAAKNYMDDVLEDDLLGQNRKPLTMPFVGETVAFDFVDRTLVLVITHTPDTDEWDKYCAFCNLHEADMRGVAVYDEGGYPNALQRKQVQNTMKQPPFIAVFSDRELMRMVIQAFGWMTDREGRMKWFALKDEIEGLTDHLRLPLTTRIQVRGARGILVQRLKMKQREKDEKVLAARQNLGRRQS